MAKRCSDPSAHGRHEWYWMNIFRRDCPGRQGRVNWDEVPLAGFCVHGVGMLDACEECDAETFIRNARP